MNINENEVAELVKAVLKEMTGSAPAASAAPKAAAQGGIPSTARVAMLTELNKFDIK